MGAAVQKKPVEYPRSALCSDLAIDGQAIKNPYKKVIRNKLQQPRKLISVPKYNVQSRKFGVATKNRKKQNHGRSDRVGLNIVSKRRRAAEPAIEKEVASEKQKKHQDENTPLPCRGNTVPTKTVTIGRTSPGCYSSSQAPSRSLQPILKTKIFSQNTHGTTHQCWIQDSHLR